jgi:uncharacterized protein YutD
MNLQEKYYTMRLYPFQDGVLNIVKKLNTDFYLTGGTALSRGYFHHRYSDDLDLFMNRRDDYSKNVQLLLKGFEDAQKNGEFSIDYNHMQKFENFAQFMLMKRIEDKEVSLKVDVVNDIAARYGDLHYDNLLGTIDSWRNILSNKLAAIFRFEAKDVADIWIIAKQRHFDWISMVEEAKTKEAAVDPVLIYEILKSFPEAELSYVKWAIPVDSGIFKKDLDLIAVDILHGRYNSLAV